MKNEPTPLELNSQTVYAWTDGSSSWRDYSGGSGVYLKFGEIEKTISKGFNNIKTGEAELTAILLCLREVTNKSFKVVITSDSQYAINTLEKWAYTWEQTCFIGKKNVELIKALLVEIRLFPKGHITFRWVKGHSGVLENEIADFLAGEGRADINNRMDFEEFKKSLA